jgi:hypothetical protein
MPAVDNPSIVVSPANAPEPSSVKLLNAIALVWYPCSTALACIFGSWPVIANNGAVPSGNRRRIVSANDRWLRVAGLKEAKKIPVGLKVPWLKVDITDLLILHW